MIAKLKGLVEHISEDGVVVDVAGVGYQVFASTRTLSDLPGTGQPVELLIETHVREDHIHLYGFASARERDLFRLLQTVQGVGAKVALGVLGALAAETLENAIAAQDKSVFAPVAGVGPKLAQRILTELKDKVAGPAFAVVGAGAALERATPSGGGSFGDAVSALVNLGYRPAEAQGAVMAAANDLGGEAPVEALIKSGLKELAR